MVGCDQKEEGYMDSKVSRRGDGEWLKLNEILKVCIKVDVGSNCVC